jgi:hypothetical protein
MESTLHPLPAARPSVALAPCPVRLGPVARIRLLPLVGMLLWKQLQVKRQAARLRPRPVALRAAAREPARKARALLAFLARLRQHNDERLHLCWTRLADLASQGCREVALYGNGDAARLLIALCRFLPLRVRAVCPFPGAAPGRDTWSEQRLAQYDGTIIIASFVNTVAHRQRLQALGTRSRRLVVLEHPTAASPCSA